MVQARRVLNFFTEQGTIDFTIEERSLGGTSYDAFGEPLTEEALETARKSDAILLGAVGGPAYDQLERHLRPEAALLRLRKELDLFANLRPAITFPALADASSLKPELVRGLDILIVRELTSGVYFGEPRGMQDHNGQERCIDTQAYTEDEIIRIADVAFEAARQRGGKLHSVDKANVMETGAFWRKIIIQRHQSHHKDVTLEHLYADNCAMQLIRAPKQFDVIVTDNLFGDLLSDCAAMLTGSLGMLPSACLGSEKSGHCAALYEPVHGSAPDIAGQNIANPIATISSLSMMMRYSFSRNDLGDKIDKAIANVLEKNIFTADIAAGRKAVSTSEMGDAILDALAQ